MKAIRYFLAFFVLFINTIYAQQKQTSIEGYYNLSEFEMASGIYLLENKSFFYFASFGGVDLKIYGNYKVEKDSLFVFYPDEELLQDFYAYAQETNTEKDSVLIKFNRPYQEINEKLIINKVHFPDFTPDKNTVSISIKNPKSTILKLEYPSRYKNKENLSFKYNNNTEDIIMIHNYYANMIRSFCLSTYKFKENYLIENKKEVARKEINEKIINEVLEFIENKRNNKTIYRDGKIYIKLKVFEADD